LTVECLKNTASGHDRFKEIPDAIYALSAALERMDEK